MAPGKAHSRLSILLADAIKLTLKVGEPILVPTPIVLEVEIKEAEIFPVFSQSGFSVFCCAVGGSYIGGTQPIQKAKEKTNKTLSRFSSIVKNKFYL